MSDTRRLPEIHIPGTVDRAGARVGRPDRQYRSQRDAALRERDEAAAEIERLRSQIELEARDPAHENCRNVEAQLEAQRDAEAENARLAQDRVQRLTEANLRLVGLLRDVREWHRCPWKHGASVEVIDLPLHAEWLARLDALLGGRS